MAHFVMLGGLRGQMFGSQSSILRTSWLLGNRCPFSVKSSSVEDVVILGVSRTPIGSFQKSLAQCSAPVLGSFAIRGALKQAKIDPNAVQECFMGVVVSAGSKQAPAKQAALMGGLSLSTPCTAVNKICASGMKSIMLAAQSIALGHQSVICAGGMESMSNAPFYLARQMPTYGGAQLLDSVVWDGLTDSKYGIHMGRCCEKTVSDLKITREEQDAYAKLSYERSQTAAKNDVFLSEITPVQITNKKSPTGFDEVSEDEEYKRVDFQRFPTLKPAFVRAEDGGTITAANASTLNDGAAAAILASASYAAKDRTLKPLARIVAYADAATDTIDFSIAPHLAVEKLLTITGVKKEDVVLWEINEAFSAVVLANMRLLGLDVKNVNVHGGAVSCGHPVGMSGARITNHLALHLKPGEKGIASICNGGGGASAIMLEGL
ncbi:Acetyl-CoA acetyltransferase, mitochondrial [Clonorchis sinensis]|uniref:acetyl-CoA C-acetyltransferase n=1 Tax=Clonorchis sinensis TaxID=79923 RepID=A0A8T1M2C6_CLOSI|nr:Acetyl-CoA acetyltransferase, mitochondrial [Clonorchis sinensis]